MTLYAVPPHGLTLCVLSLTGRGCRQLVSGAGHRACERGGVQRAAGVRLKPALTRRAGQVIDGVSERGGHPVIRRPMRQWMLRITAYADRLLEDLDGLDWCVTARG